jgi:hypothetical protein
VSLYFDVKAANGQNRRGSLGGGNGRRDRPTGLAAAPKISMLVDCTGIDEKGKVKKTIGNDQGSSTIVKRSVPPSKNPSVLTIVADRCGSLTIV